ncbi:unnamed protein product [Lupinus luteus]|uniref:AMP-dependent synthetase/ligase domain-containing protein n=1 Tax=Lupinus luteus TaxID=3873 RepID=A0AAV1Y941_LUPLU
MPTKVCHNSIEADNVEADNVEVRRNILFTLCLQKTHSHIQILRKREMRKNIRKLGVKDFVNAGLTVEEANEFDGVLSNIISISSSPTDTWHHLVYWSLILKELSVSFVEPPKCILDTSDPSKHGGTWLPGSVLNIADCCLQPSAHPNKKDDSIAIIWRDEGFDDAKVNRISLKQLRQQVMLVASAIDATFSRGDAIAIDMQMTANAVIIYLAIVLAGCVVVSIADSFAPKEIEARLRISKAKGIFTQDFISRGGRKFPLYSRVIEAASCKVIVLPVIGDDLGVRLREQDLSWKDFLFSVRSDHYAPIYQPVDSVTNILFSSGTTGDPKAIPWTQLAPIRSAADGWALIDIQPGDVYCWPTNLGWVMGPTLIYHCLLTGATLALYHGSPQGHGFGKFVQDAGVTILGTVPSLVKTWKSTQCMEGLDWTKIK